MQHDVEIGVGRITAEHGDLAVKSRKIIHAVSFPNAAVQGVRRTVGAGKAGNKDLHQFNAGTGSQRNVIGTRTEGTERSGIKPFSVDVDKGNAIFVNDFNHLFSPLACYFSLTNSIVVPLGA